MFLCSDLSVHWPNRAKGKAPWPHGPSLHLRVRPVKMDGWKIAPRLPFLGGYFGLCSEANLLMKLVSDRVNLRFFCFKT